MDKVNEVTEQFENLIDNELLLAFMETSLYKKNFRFPVYYNKPYWDVDLETLPLDTRSLNALQRNGLKTARQLVSLCLGSRNESFNHLRGFGASSQIKTIHAVFIYQYQQLDPVNKREFIRKIFELN